MLLLGPILVIAILSSAFSELMKSYEGVDEFSVGYRVEKESRMADSMEAIKDAGAEAGITFCEYPEGEPEEVVAHNELAGFVEFTDDLYVLYQSADYEVEGITLEYFLSRVMSESTDAVLQGMNPVEESDITLPIQELEFMPAISSQDYYGIIEIVYFGWCGFVCATGVLSNEKKYGIERKLQVSRLSGLQMYLGKLIPITITAALGVGISAIATVLLFGIHWGNPVLSAVIIFAMILAASSLGMMVYNISGNLVITIIVLFTVVWFMGFFGGSFETYMFSALPDFDKHLSPIYHGNRALVELSCMGRSEYVGTAIIYSLAMAAVCSAIAVMASGIRRRGRA